MIDIKVLLTEEYDEDEDIVESEIIDFTPEDYCDVSGQEIEDLEVDGVPVETVYIGIDPNDETNESAYAGWLLKDGRYYVVGLNIDKFVENYDEMVDIINNGF